MLPPRWFRRLTLAPLVLVVTMVVLTTLPLLVIPAAVASPWLPGRWRPLRMLGFALVFLAAESVGVVVLGVLWLASGCGRHLRSEAFEERHYQVLRAYLGVIVGAAQRAFRVVIDVEGLEQADRRVPLLVFSRHAGPGDSALLVNELLARRRRPRIVLKDFLQWAPCLDILLNRLPSRFIVPGGVGDDIAAIRELAAGMGPSDALVLFPEGGNFSERRRLRSIAKLEELGRHEHAEQARLMRHVLAPRVGGALAALEGAPAADVLFVAHTGLEELSGLVDLWRGLPMDDEVDARVWRVSAGDVPRQEPQRIAWLFDWWRRIDAWIVQRRGPQHVPDAIVQAVSGDAT